MNKTNKISEQAVTFTKILDFYWKFISVYAITLLVYIMFALLILEKEFIEIPKDPLVLLLAFFILVSGIGLLINLYRDREVIVSTNFITFKNRFIEKTYTLDDIIDIKFGRERNAKIHGDNRIIKIKVKDRRRILRIKPNTFWNDKKLVKCIANLKKSLMEKSETNS